MVFIKNSLNWNKDSKFSGCLDSEFLFLYQYPHPENPEVVK